MTIEIGPDGTPIVTPTNSEPVTSIPDSKVTNDSSKPELDKVMDETIARNDTNEKVTEETAVIFKTSRPAQLAAIRVILKRGMDSQQVEKAMIDIAKVL